jgi:hypothetical protein
LKLFKRRSEETIQKKKDRKIEECIKKATRRMNPIQAFMFRDNCLKNLEEKEWEKRTPNLNNIITKELFEENISENVCINAQKLLK